MRTTNAKKQRLCINGRFLCRQPTGVDRFAGEILRIFDRWAGMDMPALRPFDVQILVPQCKELRWMPKSLRLRRVGVLRGQVWEQISLVFNSRKAFLLNLCNTAPLMKKNQMVIIHDAAPIRQQESFSWVFRKWYRLLLPMVGRMSRCIGTVSEFSAREIETYYGIPCDSISVIPNSAEHVLRIRPDVSILERLGLDGKEYLLAVGTKARHKNVGILAELARRVKENGLTVVLTGGERKLVFGTQDRSGLGQVVCTGYVSDEELVALFQNAKCFVFPSNYEGFGIPPLEAMQLGCPVVSSNASAMVEVLGNAAAFFSPDDVDGLHSQVLAVCSDGRLRADLIERGLRRAGEFKWETAARMVLEACSLPAAPDMGNAAT